ncbi:MAG: caspase family protein, partial [Acidobacteria bacterium]|nr:caspase family protein [Acidobacteriota bacterium]
MPATLSVLCVHGVGHGDQDATLKPTWTDAITKNLKRWQPALTVDCQFFRYDDAFDHEPLNGLVYSRALAELLASGVIHGIGDLFGATRGLADVPDQIRWTAGMVAQWASEEKLREALRKKLLDWMQKGSFSLVCAHSLGSLVCYDTFRRNPGALANKTLLTFGSQIGNPCVRDCFAGRIEPLRAKQWYHLYNRDDHVLTAHVRLDAPNFAEVLTEFDKPGDILNHDPIFYFNHQNTQARVWPDVAGGRASRSVTRAFVPLAKAAARPDRRALLVGINDYPNPANRLEGCVNDVFLISAALQDSGFRAEEVRIVLDDRATTANLLERLHWLLDHVPETGERVLFYSGHGAQIPSYAVSGEVDHLDECLVPYDFDWTPDHAIRDKQFVEFYSQLPYASRFVAIFDCCHSGGLTREGGLRPRGLTPPDDIRHRAMQWDDGRWLNRTFAERTGDRYRIGRGRHVRQLARHRYMRDRKAFGHKGPYLPVMFEACQERELSYEYRDGATSYGAFTFSLT